MTRGVPHHAPVPGPNFMEPFTVLDGVCVVVGARFSVPLVPGGTWPGAGALPADLAQLMEPCDCVALTAAVASTPHVTPRDLEVGVANVWAHALGRLPVPVSMPALQGLGVNLGRVNHMSVGAAVNVGRERVGQVLGLMRSRGEIRHEQAAD